MAFLISAIVFLIIGIVATKTAKENEGLLLAIGSVVFLVLAVVSVFAMLIMCSSYRRTLAEIRSVQVDCLKAYQTSDKTADDYEWLLDKIEQTNDMLNDLENTEEKSSWLDIFFFVAPKAKEYRIEIADNEIILPEAYQNMIAPKRPKNYGVEDDTEDVVADNSSEVETVVIDGTTYAMIGDKLYEVVKGETVETTAVEYNSNVLVVDTSTDDIEDICEEGLYGE